MILNEKAVFKYFICVKSARSHLVLPRVLQACFRVCIHPSSLLSNIWKMQLPLTIVRLSGRDHEYWIEILFLQNLVWTTINRFNGVCLCFRPVLNHFQIQNIPKSVLIADECRSKLLCLRGKHLPFQQICFV